MKTIPWKMDFYEKIHFSVPLKIRSITSSLERPLYSLSNSPDISCTHIIFQTDRQNSVVKQTLFKENAVFIYKYTFLLPHKLL